MISRELVFTALDEEREYQEMRARKAGTPEGTVRQHSLEEWTVYIEDYLREMKTELARVWTPDRHPTPKALHILRKITAMGVAAMEQDMTLFREDEERAKVESMRP